MSVAQRLYEGIETGEGQVGLITYMRTDSTAIAGVAMGEAREVIGERYGPEYTMPKGRVYKTKSKGAQEAHESIRPTSFRRDPDSVAGSLQPDELRLYRLIWQRALASQMAPKELETTTIELADGPYELRASATKVLFDGFARVYTEGRDDEATDDDEETGRLPALDGRRPDDASEDVTPTQHFTEPPPRFTEATLIKALEEHGIGRPSTYAATISTITDRGYVRVEERRLHPEPVAEIVTDLLVEHFGDYVDVAFTARMEEELDEIARGEREWVPLLRAFYGPLQEAASTRSGDEIERCGFTTEATDEVCSEGHPMVIRLGRNGPFLACSLYPEHKETRPVPGDEPPPQEGTGEVCPEVRRGDAGQQDRAVRAVRRLLALPGLQVHQEGRPAAARSAAVRGHLPQEQGRPSRPASRAAHGERLLGVLQLPALRLHHEPRAARWPARHRRRPAGAQGRGGDLPHLRLDQRHAGGRHRAGRASTPVARRTPRPSPVRPAPAVAREPAARPKGGGRPRGGARSGGPIDDQTHSPGRAGPRRVSGEAAGQTTDPVLARFLRSLAARDASPHTQRAYATAVGAYLDWLAARGTDWRRPTRADLRAYLGRPRRGPRPIVGRAAAGRHPLVPSLGDPRATSRRATRGARSPRRASRAGCRASSRSSRSTRCWRSSRRTSRPSRATTPSMPPSGSRWPCATGRWSRRPTPPVCASASSRRRRSVRSTSGAARSGSWARAARSASGCWGGRPRQALADYLEDGRPVLLERGAAAPSRRRSRSS